MLHDFKIDYPWLWVVCIDKRLLEQKSFRMALLEWVSSRQQKALKWSISTQNTLDCGLIEIGRSSICYCKAICRTDFLLHNLPIFIIIIKRELLKPSGNCQIYGVNTVCCFFSRTHLHRFCLHCYGRGPFLQFLRKRSSHFFYGPNRTGQGTYEMQKRPSQNLPNECSCPASGSCVLLYRRGWQSDAVISTTQQCLKVRGGSAVCFDATV